MRTKHFVQDTWKPLLVAAGLALGTYYTVVVEGPRTNLSQLTNDLHYIQEEVAALDTLKTKNVCINESRVFRAQASAAEEALGRARDYGRAYETIVARLTLSEGKDVREQLYKLAKPGFDAMTRVRSLIHITKALDSMAGDPLLLPEEHTDTALVQAYYEALTACQLAEAREARQALERLYADSAPQH